MEEVKRVYVRAKFFKKISKNLSDFCIHLCSTKDYKNIPTSIKKSGSQAYITITGNNLPEIESVEIDYYGEWVENKTYGSQFKACSYKIVMPDNEKGIKALLKSKAFPGIGDKTAKALIDKFGDKTLEVLKNDPNKLLTVEGISVTKLGTIVDSCRRNEAYSDIMIFLGKYGITSDAVVNIYEKYGQEAIDIIERNPYVILNIHGVSFYKCDLIARDLKVALDSFDRIKGAIVEVLRNDVLITGNTCMVANDFVTKTMQLLNFGYETEVVSMDCFREVARTLKVRNEISFVDKNFVFLNKYSLAEEYSAYKLAKMVKKKVGATKQQIIDVVSRYRENSEFPLSDKQVQAITQALSNKVSIVTGGPGTGKTTILRAIIECYYELYKTDAILLAPTGKAARRMSETTKQETSTIHSKLGIYDTEEQYNGELLPETIIAVDEFSMVDALVFEKLLRAIPEKAQVVFIGDVDQLPSISAGNVLSDLIASNVIPVVKLTEIFRQADGGSVLENVRRIISRNTELVTDNDFEIKEVKSEDDALKELGDCYLKETKKYGIDNVCVLTPLRRSQNGKFKVVSDGLNKYLQELVNPREKGSFCILNNTEYRVGDKVLQWKNKELASNGDIGKIVDITSDNGDILVDIDWDNGNCTTENKITMNDISLAYSISVHKSQGSEYKSVIIPILSNQKNPNFQNNMIYTAVSRSKEKATLICQTEALNYCITHNMRQRLTLLKERLVYAKAQA